MMSLDSYVRKGFFALDEKDKRRRPGYYVVYLAPFEFTAVRQRIKWPRLSGISWRKRRPIWRKKNPYYSYLRR